LPGNLRSSLFTIMHEEVTLAILCNELADGANSVLDPMTTQQSRFLFRGPENDNGYEDI
jgi:hypothetical protein